MTTTSKNPSHLLSGWRFMSLILIVCLSIGGYLTMMLWAGWQDVVASVVRIGFWGVCACLVLSLVNYLFRFIRWQIFLDVLNSYVPLWPSLKIYISGFSLTATPAKAGEMLRGLFLRDYGVSYHASFGAFLAERVSDLIAVLLLAIIGLWEYPSARWICFGTGVVIVCTLFALQQSHWLAAIQRWSFRFLSRKLSRWIFFLMKILLAFRRCFSWQVIGKGSVLGMIAWGAEGLAFWYLLHLMGADLPVSTSVFIYAFSMLVGAITFLPGGLVGTEVTMLNLLIFYNVPSADAALATVLIRLTTLWFAVVLGLLLLPILQFNRQEKADS